MNTRRIAELIVDDLTEELGTSLVREVMSVLQDRSGTQAAPAAQAVRKRGPGRPRKDGNGDAAPRRPGRPRKAATAEAGAVTKRRPGRPRKSDAVAASDPVVESTTPAVTDDAPIST